MRLRDLGSKNVKELSEEHPAGTDANKDELQQNEKTYELLEESIEELSEEQRQCVILFYLKKNSYTEISSKTGYSMMQVKSFIQNGKRNLKIILDRKMKARGQGNER